LKTKPKPIPQERLHKKLTRVEGLLFIGICAVMFTVSLWKLWEINPLLAAGIIIPFMYLGLTYLEKVCETCPQQNCPMKWLKPSEKIK
jgi:hypothetical protein